VGLEVRDRDAGARRRALEHRALVSDRRRQGLRGEAQAATSKVLAIGIRGVSADERAGRVTEPQRLGDGLLVTGMSTAREIRDLGVLVEL
jgi:hypothetical protein